MEVRLCRAMAGAFIISLSLQGMRWEVITGGIVERLKPKKIKAELASPPTSQIIC